MIALCLWANSLDLADALAMSLRFANVEKTLDEISKLYDDHFTFDLVLKDFNTRVLDKIRYSFRKLKHALHAKVHQRKLQTKFNIYSMECGGIDDFHKGILERIGHTMLQNYFSFVAAQQT